MKKRSVGASPAYPWPSSFLVHFSKTVDPASSCKLPICFLYSSTPLQIPGVTSQICCAGEKVALTTPARLVPAASVVLVKQWNSANTVQGKCSLLSPSLLRVEQQRGRTHVGVETGGQVDPLGAYCSSPVRHLETGSWAAALPHQSVVVSPLLHRQSRSTTPLSLAAVIFSPLTQSDCAIRVLQNATAAPFDGASTNSTPWRRARCSDNAVPPADTTRSYAGSACSAERNENIHARGTGKTTRYIAEAPVTGSCNFPLQYLSNAALTCEPRQVRAALVVYSPTPAGVPSSTSLRTSLWLTSVYATPYNFVTAFASQLLARYCSSLSRGFPCDALHGCRETLSIFHGADCKCLPETALRSTATDSCNGDGRSARSAALVARSHVSRWCSGRGTWANHSIGLGHVPGTHRCHRAHMVCICLLAASRTATCEPDCFATHKGEQTVSCSHVRAHVCDDLARNHDSLPIRTTENTFKRGHSKPGCGLERPCTMCAQAGDFLGDGIVCQVESQFSLEAVCSGGASLKQANVSNSVNDVHTRKTEDKEIFDKSSAPALPIGRLSFGKTRAGKGLVERALQKMHALPTLSWEEAQAVVKDNPGQREEGVSKQDACHCVPTTQACFSSNSTATVVSRNVCAGMRIEKLSQDNLKEGRQLSPLVQQQSRTPQTEANENHSVTDWDAVRAACPATEQNLIISGWKAVSELNSSEEMSSERELDCGFNPAKTLSATGNATSAFVVVSSPRCAPRKDIQKTTADSSCAGTSLLFPHPQTSRSVHPSEFAYRAAGPVPVCSLTQATSCTHAAEIKNCASSNRVPLAAGKTACERSHFGHLSVARRHLRLVPVHAPGGRGTGGEKRRSGTTPAKSRRALRAVKVAIIGAGMAGVSAACALRSAGVTCVTIFEARSRIGGRCCSARVDLQRYTARPQSKIHSSAAGKTADSALSPEPSSISFSLVPTSMHEARSTEEREILLGRRCKSSGTVGGDGERTMARTCCFGEGVSPNPSADCSDGGRSQCTRTATGGPASVRAADEAAGEACGVPLCPPATTGRALVDSFADVHAKTAEGVPACDCVSMADKAALSSSGSQARSCKSACVSAPAAPAPHYCRLRPPGESPMTDTAYSQCTPLCDIPLDTSADNSGLPPAQSTIEACSSLRTKWQTTSGKAAATRAISPVQEGSNVFVGSSFCKNLPAGGAKYGLAGEGEACSGGCTTGNFVVDGIDLGASWIHGIDENPVYKVCLAKGLHPYGAAGGEDFCCGGGCCFDSATTSGTRPCVAGGSAGHIAPLVDEALFDETTGQLADASVDAWAYQTHQRHQVEAERDGGSSRDYKGDRANRDWEGREAAQSPDRPVRVSHKTEKNKAVSRVGRKRCKSEEKGEYVEDEAKRLRWTRQRKLLWMSLGSGLNRRLEEAVRGIKQRRQQEHQNRSSSSPGESEGREGESGQTCTVKELREGVLKEAKTTEGDTVNWLREQIERNDQAGDMSGDQKDKSLLLDTTSYALESNECGKTRDACSFTSQTHAAEGGGHLRRELEKNNVSLDNNKGELAESCLAQHSVWKAADQKQRPEQIAAGLVEQGPAKEVDSEPGDCVEGRLLMWHLNNIEYSAGADVEDLSMMCWDQDDLTAFQGQHVLIWEGYKAAVEVQARSLDIRLRQVVTGIQYSSAGVRLFFEHGGGCSELFDFCICTVPLGVLKASVEAYEQQQQLLTRSCAPVGNKTGGQNCEQPIAGPLSEGCAAGGGAQFDPAQAAACQRVAAASEGAVRGSEAEKLSPVTVVVSPVEQDCRGAGGEERMHAIVGQDERIAAGDASSQATCSAECARESSPEAEKKKRAQFHPDDLGSLTSYLQRHVSAATEAPFAAEQTDSPEKVGGVSCDSSRTLTTVVAPAPGAPADGRTVSLLSRDPAPAAETETSLLCGPSHREAESSSPLADGGLCDSKRAASGALRSSAAAVGGGGACYPSHFCQSLPPSPAAAESTCAPAGCRTDTVNADCGLLRESPAGRAGGGVGIDNEFVISRPRAADCFSGVDAANMSGADFGDEPQDSLHDVPVKFSISKRLLPYLMEEETGEAGYEEISSPLCTSPASRNALAGEGSHAESANDRLSLVLQAPGYAAGGSQESLYPAAAAAASSIERTDRGDCRSHAEQTGLQALGRGVKQRLQQKSHLSEEEGLITCRREISATERPLSDEEPAADTSVVVGDEVREQQRIRRDNTPAHTYSTSAPCSGLSDSAAGRQKLQCGVLQNAQLHAVDSGGAAAADAAAANHSSIISEEAEKAASERQSRQSGENSSTAERETPSLRLWRMLEKARCSSTRGLLQFDPPLPEWKRAAIKLVGMGNMNKIAFVFRRPFWLQSSAAALQPSTTSGTCCSGGASTSESGAQQAAAAQSTEQENGKKHEKAESMETRENRQTVSTAVHFVGDISNNEEADTETVDEASAWHCPPAAAAAVGEDIGEVTCLGCTDNPSQDSPRRLEETAAALHARGTAAAGIGSTIGKHGRDDDYASGILRSSGAGSGLTEGASSCSSTSSRQNAAVSGDGESSSSRRKTAVFCAGNGTGSSTWFPNEDDIPKLASTESSAHLCSGETDLSRRSMGDKLRACTGCCPTTSSGSSGEYFAGEGRLTSCSRPAGTEEGASAIVSSDAAAASCVGCSRNLPADDEDSARSTALPVEESPPLQTSSEDTVPPAAVLSPVICYGPKTGEGDPQLSKNREVTMLDSSEKPACMSGGEDPSLAAETSDAGNLHVICKPTTGAAAETGKLRRENNSSPPTSLSAAAADPGRSRSPGPLVDHSTSSGWSLPADSLSPVRLGTDAATSGGGVVTSGSLSPNYDIAADIATACGADTISDNTAATVPPPRVCPAAAAVVVSALTSSVPSIPQSQSSAAGQLEATTAADSPVSVAEEARTAAALRSYTTRHPPEKSGRHQQPGAQQLQDYGPSAVAAAEEKTGDGKRLRRAGGRGAERGGGRSGLLRREGRARASVGTEMRSSRTPTGRGGWQREGGVAAGGKKARFAAAGTTSAAESSAKGVQAENPMSSCGCRKWQHVPRQRGWASKEKGRYSQIVYLHPKPVILVLMPGSFSFKSERRQKSELVEEALEVLAKIHGKIEVPVAAFVSRWGKDPFARGSYSYLPPGSTGRDYDILSYPVSDRLLFAGEHTMRPYPSTVHGACLSGKREAERIVDWVTGTLKRSSLFKWFHSEKDDQWFPMGVDEMETAASYFEDIVEGPESSERYEWFAGSITCGFCGEPQTLERPFIGCISIPLPLSETLFCRPKKKAALAGLAAHPAAAAGHNSSSCSTSSSTAPHTNADRSRSRSRSSSSSTASKGVLTMSPETPDEAVGGTGGGAGTAAAAAPATAASASATTTTTAAASASATTASAATATAAATAAADVSGGFPPHAEESSNTPRPASESAAGVSRLRVAVHEDCSYHSLTVVSNNEGSRWFNVSRAVTRAAATLCCCCDKPGASVPCAAPMCSNAAHVPCAKRHLHWPRYRMGRFAYPLYCTAHQSLLPISSRSSLSAKGSSSAAAAARKKLRRASPPGAAAAYFTCCSCGSLYADSSGDRAEAAAAAATSVPHTSGSASDSKKEKFKGAAAAAADVGPPHWCLACISRKKDTENNNNKRVKPNNLSETEAEYARGKEQKHTLTGEDAAVTATLSPAFSAAAGAAAASAAVALCERIRGDSGEIIMLHKAFPHRQQQQRRLQQQQEGGDKLRRTDIASERSEKLLDEMRNTTTEMHAHCVRSRIDSVRLDEDQLFIDILRRDPAWRQKHSSNECATKLSNVNKPSNSPSHQTEASDVIAELMNTTRPLPPARPVVLSSKTRDDKSRMQQLQSAVKLLDPQQAQQPRPQQQQQQPQPQSAAVLRQSCMLRQLLRSSSSPQQHAELLREKRSVAVAGGRQERELGREEGGEMQIRGSSAQSFVRQVQLVLEQLERVTHFSTEKLGRATAEVSHIDKLYVGKAAEHPTLLREHEGNNFRT